jgi:flagellin-like protein
MKKRLLKNNKGLSAIVATLIIILLVLVAAGIVWVVVRNLVQEGAEGIELGRFTLDLEIKAAQIENGDVTVIVVRRNPGEGNFVGMNFVFSDGTNSEIIRENTSLQELEERSFTFTLTEIGTSNLETISVAPIFELSSGEESVGTIADSFGVLEGIQGNGGIDKTETEINISDVWNSPVNLGEPINTEKWEDAPSISPDGETLYFAIGEGLSVDSYYSVKIENEWSNPIPHEFNLNDFPEGAVHTQDNQILYFASIRPGTIGLGDIYVYENNEVENLGGPVNTENMEAEPYISPDGNTLYFAAVRADGLGGVDIWFSEKVGEVWQEPENIGPPVNSNIDETQPFITDDGQELYFTAINRDGIAGPAIFKSIKQNGEWGNPEVVVSGFVGEPTLTADKSKLYFVHIFREGEELLDADIYVAEKK